MVFALWFPVTTAAFIASTARRNMTSLQAGQMMTLLDASGAAVSRESLQNKRIALYFSAGWCPMCTSFEPSLQKFRQAANESGNAVEIIYVPSDRSPEAHQQRVSQLDMLTVPYEEADAYKTDYKIWSGSESVKLGSGRRSGVPALVVLDKNGKEMAFLAAESQGTKALQAWPLDEETGVWGG